MSIDNGEVKYYQPRFANRLEINIPGENGILSKKIYYLKPEPPKNSIELIPISYQDFLKWKL